MAILKNLKEDEKIFLEIFGLKCVSNHSKSIPEKKIFRNFFDFGPPKMAPQRAKMDKNTQNCPKNIFSLYFLFIVAFSSALGSFSTIPHYPSSYNTVDTFLDPRKWPHNEQKWTKTPKKARKNIFCNFSFYSCVFL